MSRKPIDVHTRQGLDRLLSRWQREKARWPLGVEHGSVSALTSSKLGPLISRLYMDHADPGVLEHALQRAVEIATGESRELFCPSLGLWAWDNRAGRRATEVADAAED